MTEKVKLTQEQADAIELASNKKGRTIEFHTKSVWQNDFAALNELNTDELVRALYIGYEVELEFEVGDWVYVIATRQVHQITGRLNNKIIYLDMDGGMTREVNVRHATPDEIAAEKEWRWWARHGRKEYELRINDVVSYDCRSWGGIYIVASDPYKGTAFKEDCVKLYNRHRMNDISIRVKDLKIICFAESRLDGDTN